MMPARLLATALSPAGARARLSILIYHRVRPTPDALHPTEVDARRFSMQMRALARTFRVLPLEEAVRHLRDATLPARAACISFDDGYLDNVEVALPILRALSLPATFFIASGFLNGTLMWNDVIIESVRQAVGPVLDLAALGLGTYEISTPVARRATLHALIDHAKYLSDAQRQAFAQRVRERCGAEHLPAVMMSPPHVRLLHDAGMGIGAHTRTHPILSRLSDQAARDEINQGRADLEAIIGREVKLFAYPNGKPGIDYSAEHVRMIEQAGFQGAVSTAWGAASVRSDRFQLPRFTPWDVQPWRFALRLLHNLRREHYEHV